MAKVTVVIPVYKTPKDYLDKCIQSVLDQSLEDFELILVDDGSHDLCSDVCDAYSNKDSRVKVIHQENKGASSARNRGLSIAKGMYLLFLDADDYLTPNALRDLYDVAQKNKTDLVLFEYKRKGKTYHLFNGTDIGCLDDAQIQKIWRATVLPHKKHGILLCGICCKFYRTDFIQQKEIRFEKEIKYRYVENSASFAFSKNFHKQVLVYGNILKSLIEKKHMDDGELIFSTRMCQCILYSLSKDFFHKKNAAPKKDRKSQFCDFTCKEIVEKSLSSYEKKYFTWSERVGLLMCKWKMFGLINLASKRW